MELSSTNTSLAKMNQSAFAKTMEMIEDNSDKLNEIINYSIKIESDIEKKLEKEDKKCTFLKHTIENLKKQRADFGRTLDEQRKYMLEKQMELEQISTTIYEQTELLGIGNPEEGITLHSDMVNGVLKMIDYVRNFKVILQNDIDECNYHNVEVQYWKTQSKEHLRRISELKTVKNQLQEKITEREINHSSDDWSFKNINRHTLELQKIHQEYKKAKDSLTNILAQKHDLEEQKQHKTLKSQEMMDALLIVYDDYQKLNQLHFDETISMYTEISEANVTANEMFLELENLIGVAKKGLEKYDTTIEEKKITLNDLKKQENLLKYENKEITLDINKLNENLSKLKMSNDMLKGQQELTQNVLNTIQSHSNSIEISITEYKVQLESLVNDLEKLKNDNNTFAMDQMMIMNEKNVPLPLKKEQLKSELEGVIVANDLLEKEHKYLKQEIKDLEYYLETELKNKIGVYDVEREFLDVLSIEVVDKQRKIEVEVNKKITECIKNVNELGNVLIEKNLLLDSIKIDVEKCRDLISSYEYRILAQAKENDDKNAKLNQIKESVANEGKNLQSKINLLQDLEKNTFSRNHMPSEWLQTFEKHRTEYDQLKKQRLMLEEKRNKSSLTSKFDSDPKKNKGHPKFTDFLENDDLGKPESPLEAKNAAFKIFKERIMKKNKAASFS